MLGLINICTIISHSFVVIVLFCLNLKSICFVSYLIIFTIVAVTKVDLYELEITIAFMADNKKLTVCAKVGSGIRKLFCIFQPLINIFFCHCTKYIMLL